MDDHLAVRTFERKASEAASSDNVLGAHQRLCLVRLLIHVLFNRIRIVSCTEKTRDVAPTSRSGPTFDYFLDTFVIIGGTVHPSVSHGRS